MKRLINYNLFEVYNKKSNKKELLKLILTDKLENENISKYMKSVNLINSLESNELIKYSKIANENNYIYLIMPKYSKSLSDVKNPVEYFCENGIFDIIMSICKGWERKIENI